VALRDVPDGVERYVARRLAPLSWIVGLATTVILLVVGGWLLQVRGVRTCGRCGATVAVRAFGPFEFPREDPASRGRKWFEALRTACVTHAWKATGCWYSSRGVSCTELPDGNPLLEWCATATDQELARGLAQRFDEVAEPERDRALRAWPLLSERSLDAASEAVRVRAFVGHVGWTDLLAR
jgi:hypothetical protein